MAGRGTTVEQAGELLHVDGCPAEEDAKLEKLRVETYEEQRPRRAVDEQGNLVVSHGTVRITRCQECGAHTIEEG